MPKEKKSRWMMMMRSSYDEFCILISDVRPGANCMSSHLPIASNFIIIMHQPCHLWTRMAVVLLLLHQLRPPFESIYFPMAPRTDKLSFCCNCIRKIRNANPSVDGHQTRPSRRCPKQLASLESFATSLALHYNRSGR